jgi:aspartate aminotransferase-like enzyme
LVGDGTVTSPAVVTIALPESLKSVEAGRLVQEAGYLVSCNSDYLRRRNWIQICLMGECAREKVVSLLNALSRVCFRRKRSKATPETAPSAAAPTAS